MTSAAGWGAPLENMKGTWCQEEDEALKRCGHVSAAQPAALWACARPCTLLRKANLHMASFLTHPLQPHMLPAIPTTPSLVERYGEGDWSNIAVQLNAMVHGRHGEMGRVGKQCREVSKS